MSEIEKIPAGYVLAWATKDDGSHPEALCGHWSDTPRGPSADCDRAAVWGIPNSTYEWADYEEYACAKHKRWLRKVGQP